MSRVTLSAHALPVLLLSSLITPSVAATIAEELEEDSSLVSDFVTPHKEWARPYAKGTVRALFFVNGGADVGAYMEPGTRIREVVELMQRFDVKGDAIIVSGGKLYQLKLGELRAHRLLAQPYDVYVFANVNLDTLDPQLEYKVLERVVAGAGLVCCGAKPTEVLAPKRKLSLLPPSLYRAVPLAEMERRLGIVKPETATAMTDTEAAGRILNAYGLGKGRGVSLEYNAWTLTPNTPFSFRALVDYDCWQMLVGRAVLWAAGKETEATVDEVLSQNPAIPQASLPLRNVGVTLSSRVPIKVRVLMSLSRSDGWRADLPSAETDLDPAKPASVEVGLPLLRADRYYLEVVVKSGKGIEAFGAGSFEVTSPDGIEAVKMNAAFVERGEGIGGQVTARGTPRTGDMIRVQLRDGYGRVLARQDLPAKPGTLDYPFVFIVGDWATIQMRAEALLMRGVREIEMKEASFLVPKRRRGQFNFVQWDMPRDVLGYYAWQKMKEAGWQVCLGGSPSEANQAADISAIPYSTRLLDQKDENGIMKPCCWNDETKVNDYVRKVVEAQRPSRETGAFVYSLGDEGTTTGCCVHPACLEAYRKYLKEQYGTIAALNGSWGSDYKSFDEVDLLDRKDNLETKALTEKLYARWYDRQAFSRYNLAQFSGRFVRAYKELDPEAITGFEGTGGFGDDFDAILGTNTFWSPYPGIGDDIIRGVASRELIRANWMGYEKTADPLINYAWRMVVKGMDSIWWWRWDGAGTWRGILKPTLDFYPAVNQLNEEMKPVREGLGDLLLKSTPVHSGIAVFYSVPAALSHGLENSREFIAPEAAHKAWLRATYDVGMDSRYLTSRLLRSGALSTNEFKVLLLPMTQAIAPGEAKDIRSFVEGGGAVIADVRPGLFDGHCKPQTPGLLDDLFGIRRTDRGKAKRVPLDLNTKLGNTPVSLQLNETNIEQGVAASTAQALGNAGDTSVFFVNAVGKGRAVLLNFELTSYKGDPTSTAKPVNGFVAALYSALGVKPPVVARGADGSYLDFVETHVWESSEATIIGLWNEMNIRFFAMDGKAKAAPEREATVTLPGERYLYDLRAGKALGKTREVRTTLLSGRANFFAAYPYPLGRLSLKLSSTSPKPGQPLDVESTLRIPKSSKAIHAVYLQVVDPKGEPAAWGNRVVLLKNGLGRTSIPIAFNDMPGRWRVKATELFSRQQTKAQWQLR